MPEKSKSKYNSLKEWEKDFPVHYRDAKSQGHIEELCESFGWDLPKYLVSFATYEQAQKWCIENNIEDMRGYQKKYKDAIDIKIPREPNNVYKDKWVNWYVFLGKDNLRDFATYDESQKWCANNNIKTYTDYQKKYKDADIRLPSTPNQTYNDYWVDWYVFLGIHPPKEITSYEQSQKWCIENNIESSTQYFDKYKDSIDIRLPSNPNETYNDYWLDWDTFLGKNNVKDFASYEETSQWCIDNNIESRRDYIKKYKGANIRLPSNPHESYKDKWLDWDTFLGKNTPKGKSTYDEAQKWCIENNIKGSADYQKKYKDADIRLPSTPYNLYKKDWVNWYVFLEKDKLKGSTHVYATYEEASRWCNDNNIKTYTDYQKKYKDADIRLPSNPHESYKKYWINWYVFLGKDNVKDFATYEQSQKWCIEKGINTQQGYQKKYKDADITLPSNPHESYKDKWLDWSTFLGKKCLTYDEAQKWCIENGIESSKQYYKKYKDINKKLPRHPNRKYKDKWVSWYTFLGKN